MKVHLHRLLAKTGCVDRHELIARVWTRGGWWEDGEFHPVSRAVSGSEAFNNGAAARFPIVLEQVRSLIPEGSRLHTRVVYHWPARDAAEVKVYLVGQDGIARPVAWLVANVLGYPQGSQGGVIVEEAGPQPGTILIRRLSEHLLGESGRIEEAPVSPTSLSESASSREQVPAASAFNRK